MKINARALADESLSVPFDPLLAVRVHSSTQLKRRATGKRGVVLMNGSQEMLDQYRHIDSLSPDAFLTADWPDILWNDMQAFHEPLSVAEKIPLAVFREIRRLRGESVTLTRELLDEARRLGLEACEGLPISQGMRNDWAHDSSGPLFVAPVLERFRERKLLSNFAIKIENDGTLKPITEAVAETMALVRAKLGIADPE